MANLRITRLGHGGVLYRSPNDAWVWVDRWSGAPNYPDAFRSAERVNKHKPRRPALSPQACKEVTPEPML